MSHTLQPFRTAASPTLRAILNDDAPPAEQARIMAQQLAGKIEAGNLRRLPQCEVYELRTLAMALDMLAAKIEVAQVKAYNDASPRYRPGWWMRIFG